jgi:hypothetical protein
VNNMSSMLQSSAVREALLRLTEHTARARSEFARWSLGDEYHEPSWAIESCFLQLLAIIESLQLSELHKLALSEYLHFRESKKGFTAGEMGPDEPYSACLSRIWRYHRAVESFFPEDEKTRVSKDLLRIIGDIHYVITDAALYGRLPFNENDVHVRIEGVLKCVYSDLKRKPTLNKPIKNFEPDTGIPSISTLIEYKFLSRAEDVSKIADQILADTRGYVSKDWKYFLYVVYETNRFKRESEWKNLLLQSEVSRNTSIVVLSGESPPNGKKRKRNNIKKS